VIDDVWADTPGPLRSVGAPCAAAVHPADLWEMSTIVEIKGKHGEDEPVLGILVRKVPWSRCLGLQNSGGED
jgi:hypothetical protein